MHDYLTPNLKYAARFSDLETCTPFSDSSEMFNDLETEDYGEGVTHVHTKPYIMTVGPDFRKKVDDIKKTLHNKRKPTEILVYTDGFSYSATSIFIKGLQDFGGAIIVGHSGNPKIEGTEQFDGVRKYNFYFLINFLLSIT